MIMVNKILPNEEPQGSLSTFPSSIFDQGLGYNEATSFLKDKELPLPQSIMNERIEKMEEYRNTVEELIGESESKLKNRAIIKPIEGIKSNQIKSLF